jgi:TusA-related sulfurtransferase
MPRGAELDLLLDDPQGAADIPRAAESAGHHVAGVEHDDECWRITIEA